MDSDCRDIYQTKSLSAMGEASRRRIERNSHDADELEAQGYTVERGMHRNGAYFAVIGDHPDHEKEVGRIFAENGFSFTLDREGNAKIKMPNGRTFTLPSYDGRVEGFTHEIYALEGTPNPQAVARGIKHSYKPFVYSPSNSIQADVAITFAPRGSEYRKRDIMEGVTEFNRQYLSGETKARPLVYLHVNGTTRIIYHWDINKRRHNLHTGCLRIKVC